MKIIPFKIAIGLMMAFALPLTGHGNDLKGRHTEEKTIKKEFEVNPDALLKIDNSYGNLVLSSWNENRVVIEVHITVSGNNESRVARKLEEISVAFEATPGMVSAKTLFNGGSGWNWKGNNVNMQVNYNVKLPVKNSVNLSNDYGGITLDRIDGHARISCDYGRVDLGELRGRNNQLSFDYLSKSRIGTMNSGEIKAGYSRFTLEKTGALVLKADYTDATLEAVETLEYMCDYGSLEVGTARDIVGKGDYISVRLGTLHGNVDIDADYGSISIDQMAADAGNISLTTDYTGIKIGYDPGYHFDFEISTEYAGVSGREPLEMKVSREKSSERYYSGYHGAADSGNRISIRSQYGNISLKKN